MSKKNQFEARLASQKAQLERNGYSAEVVVRTTPEATDIINYARLWEYIIVQADRKTRGYMSKSSRDDFDKTRREYQECMSLMSEKIQSAAKRHDLDLTGTNFVSRIAQRYGIVDRVRKNPPQVQNEPKAKEQQQSTEVKKIALDEVDGL